MTDTKNPSGRPDKFPKKRGPEKSARRKICEAAGMSRHQMYQMVQIGNIPEDEFERLVESDEGITITELARIGRGEQSKPKPSPDSYHELRRAWNRASPEARDRLLQEEGG